MKYLNKITVSIGVVGGSVASLLGGYDLLLKSLLIVIGLDYLTGVLKAAYEGKLSADIGMKGIIKKVFNFVIVALTVIVDNVLGGTTPIREVIITGLISNEGISILKNSSQFINIPKKLQDILEKMKDVG